MKKHNITFEIHIFLHGVQGLSLCDERAANDPSLINTEAGKGVSYVWIGLKEDKF